MPFTYYKGIVSYDGTDYSGWQLQKQHPTIQGELEKVLKKIFPSDLIRVNGASRTDAGVHALGQCFHFKTTKHISPEKLMLGMNSLLPLSIYVKNLTLTHQSFHSRFHAIGKYYTYSYAFPPDPLIVRYAYALMLKPDIETMKYTTSFFIGEKDFSAFRNLGSKDKDLSPVCNISTCYIEEHPNLITLHIKGNRFLYNMIRIIAGTLLYTGYHKLTPTEIEDAFIHKDRKKMGKTLAPNGLKLIEVFYPED